jgi:plastocyanin
MHETRADGRDGACSRRAALAALGAGGLSAAGAAAAQEDGGGEGGGGTTHTVNMTDGLKFEPDSLTVAAGDTVVWENVGGIGHSVTAYENEIPDGATYWASGGFDSEQAARDAYSAGDPDSGDVAGGESYEHTFETTGTHGYFCIPHEAAGMKGEIEVVEQLAESGGSEPAVPPAAATLAAATAGGVAVVLALAVAFLKYGGSGPAEE